MQHLKSRDSVASRARAYPSEASFSMAYSRLVVSLMSGNPKYRHCTGGGAQSRKTDAALGVCVCTSARIRSYFHAPAGVTEFLNGFASLGFFRGDTTPIEKKRAFINCVTRCGCCGSGVNFKSSELRGAQNTLKISMKPHNRASRGARGEKSQKKGKAIYERPLSLSTNMGRVLGRIDDWKPNRGKVRNV